MVNFKKKRCWWPAKKMTSGQWIWFGTKYWCEQQRSYFNHVEPITLTIEERYWLEESLKQNVAGFGDET